MIKYDSLYLILMKIYNCNSSCDTNERDRGRGRQREGETERSPVLSLHTSLRGYNRCCIGTIGLSFVVAQFKVNPFPQKPTTISTSIYYCFEHSSTNTIIYHIFLIDMTVTGQTNIRGCRRKCAPVCMYVCPQSSYTHTYEHASPLLVHIPTHMFACMYVCPSVRVCMYLFSYLSVFFVLSV